MVRYLGEKNIINSEECFKYYEDNIKNILKEAQKAFEEYNEKYKKEKADFIEKVDD